jgi:hypothetical protein
LRILLFRDGQTRREMALEDTYPHIAEWVQDHGWIEVGHDEHGTSFIRALDIGGLVWEGKTGYGTIDEAFQDLEAGLTEWMRQGF